MFGYIPNTFAHGMGVESVCGIVWVRFQLAGVYNEIKPTKSTHSVCCSLLAMSSEVSPAAFA